AMKRKLSGLLELSSLFSLFVLLQCGCGDKKATDTGTPGDGKSGSSTTAPAAGTASGGIIRIGEFASLTGKEAAFGNSSHKGTVLAIEQLNAAGGVLGKQLELVSEDNRTTQGESATVVQKLI